jgi:hypothetical protein
VWLPSPTIADSTRRASATRQHKVFVDNSILATRTTRTIFNEELLTRDHNADRYTIGFRLECIF